MLAKILPGAILFSPTHRRKLSTFYFFTNHMKDLFILAMNYFWSTAPFLQWLEWLQWYITSSIIIVSILGWVTMFSYFFCSLKNFVCICVCMYSLKIREKLISCLLGGLFFVQLEFCEQKFFLLGLMNMFHRLKTPKASPNSILKYLCKVLNEILNIIDLKLHQMLYSKNHLGWECENISESNC